MNHPFVTEQLYSAPIEKVWQHLSETDKMKEWYFPQLIEFVPEVGFEFKFKDDGSRFQKEWTVTKIIKGQTLAHTWVYKGYPGLSEVTFELFKEGAKTRLKLTHEGLETFPDDAHFARQRFVDGWAQLLGVKLKQMLEHAS
ncbi:ATPase [Sphingobacteriaceae bacterium]|nr:ATPase [Sphingobacteriaceae bacterium]